MIKNSLLILSGFALFHLNVSGMNQNKKAEKLAKEFKDVRARLNNAQHSLDNAQHNFTYNFINDLQSGVAQALAQIAVQQTFDWTAYGIKKVYHKITGIEDLKDIQYKQSLVANDDNIRNNQQALLSNDIVMLNKMQDIIDRCEDHQLKEVLQSKLNHASLLTLENIVKHQKTVKIAPLPAHRLRQDPKIFNTPNPALSRLNLNDIPQLNDLQSSSQEVDEEYDDDDKFADDYDDE